MRLPAAVVFALIIAGGVRAQPFEESVRRGLDRPGSFSFVDGERTCHVTAAGAALCQRKGGRDWPFRLPVADGRINSLSFARYRDDLLLAYELDDGEGGWAQIVRIARGAKEPRWRFHVRGFNMATPVLHEGTILVAALAFLARIDTESGWPDWRLERVYAGGGFEIPELEVAGKRVIVHSRDGTTDQRRSECFDVKTGACTSCGS